MKKCILIYDDDADILMVCKIILEKNNYAVETRLFCDNIINDISEVQPDIILMDLWIPTIGGENAIKLMKNNSATLHIPVILFSANAQIAEIAERANANGFLLKPFDIDVFVETVKNTLTEKKK
jgi:DNA-binding NtrC family response regulator